MIYTKERLGSIWHELQPLLYEHWDAIAHKELMGNLAIDEQAYRQLDNVGALHITTARLNTPSDTVQNAAVTCSGAGPHIGDLVGYAVYIINRNMHYKQHIVAEADIFYLRPQYRRGLAGVRLMRAAEEHLCASGVSIITQKVKVAHDCGAIFRRMGYVHVENVYMRGVSHGL